MEFIHLDRKEIKGFEDYEVDTEGNVWSMKFGKERKLKLAKDKNGYLQVNFCKEGEKQTFSVHRLVANAFIENPESKYEVNHINEVKVDNRVSNLEWNTRFENCRHPFLGSKGRNAKPKEYYATKSTTRATFKKTCKRQGWGFEEFEEIGSGEKCWTNKKYYYIEKWEA